MNNISEILEKKQKELISVLSNYRNQIPEGNSFFFAIIEKDTSYYYNLDKFYKKNSKTEEILIRNARLFPQECIDTIRDLIGEIRNKPNLYLYNSPSYTGYLDFIENDAIKSLFQFNKIKKSVLLEHKFIEKTLKLLSAIRFKHSLLIHRKHRFEKGLMAEMIRFNFPSLLFEDTSSNTNNNVDFKLGCYLESWLFVGETMHFHYVLDHQNDPVGAYIFFSDRERYKPNTGLKRDIEEILKPFKIDTNLSNVIQGNPLNKRKHDQEL